MCMLNPLFPRALWLLSERLGITPYHHQAVAVSRGLELFEKHGSFGLLHEMGCGKTLSMLGLFDLYGARKMLVVCPLAVMGAWEKDAPRLDGARCVLLQGSGEKKLRTLNEALADDSSPLIVVVNYESIWRGDLGKQVMSAGFDIVVCDESQRIKSPSSKVSKFLGRLADRVGVRVIMTGTPVSEGALGWYGQFRFLDKSVLGKSFVNFKSRYAVEVDTGSYRMVVGLKNLDELEDKVMARCHRVSKAEALDLPDEVNMEVVFDLSAKARRVYDGLVRESFAALDDERFVSVDNALSRLLRLQQVTGGFAPDADGELVLVDDGKIRACESVVDDLLDAGKKCVIFYRFSAEGDRIRSMLEGKKIGFASIYGGVKGSDRSELVRRFQEDDDCRVFVAQIQAAGLGITLTAADTSIFFSTGFSAGDYEQARARVHRIGQDKRVTHIHLLARDSVDEKVFRVLEEKRSVSEDLVDGGWKRYLE